MNLIRPDWIGIPANIGALATTRLSGFSQGCYGDGAGGSGLNLGAHVGDQMQLVRKNRDLLQTQLPAAPAWLTQVHGVTVVDAAMATDAQQADASIATEPGVICAIQTADCLPVLFCDAAGKVVGAAHAGWRGLAAGVLENTVARMRAAGAGEIIAWLGPAIGPQCFEVGAEVMHTFIEGESKLQAAFQPVTHRPEKFLADIYLLARLVLTKAGVTQIYGGGYCTVTQRDMFYSYRRDGVTGRMASLVWMK